MLELTLRCDDDTLITALAALAELRPFALTAPTAVHAVNDPTADRFQAADGIVTDTHTGLQWSQEDTTAKAVPWAAAEAACRALRLGGHDDWRLPTRTELLTLVDDTRHEPAIDTEAFPACKSEWYWTGTPYAPSPAAFAWLVCFGSGSASGFHRDGYNRVRAVRGPARQF
jgi:hypothetical protein